MRACHGLDGHKPTDAGRWMYPRAADLTSREVQQYPECELFWIVKNGIRLSGMPAFGKVETDEHIWNLVHYCSDSACGTDTALGPASVTRATSRRTKFVASMSTG